MRIFFDARMMVSCFENSCFLVTYSLLPSPLSLRAVVVETGASHQVCLQHFQAEHVAKLTLRDAPPVEGDPETDTPCLCSKVCIPMRSLVMRHAKTCTETECVVPMCNFSIYNEPPLRPKSLSGRADSETANSLATTPIPSSSSGTASSSVEAHGGAYSGS